MFYYYRPAHHTSLLSCDEMSLVMDGFKPGLYAGVLTGFAAHTVVGTGLGGCCASTRTVAPLIMTASERTRVMLMSFIRPRVESYPRPCKNAGDHPAKIANIPAKRAVRNLEPLPSRRLGR